ncbi:S-formylglutathione hydrolase [uncultured Legionella sp.]|uniref:S-formylglutathione hydrolase n=1 Tax=uncultured Legionella sp. TaxID=210934 RepID=UPI00262B44DB|nr:S-formylglutathione hydrolase [uncultured Legionella sp.]
MSLRQLEMNRCFDGTQTVYTHWSETTRSAMNFALYLPPQAEQHSVPVLFWLSGLTCTEQNFITKAGAQRMASLLGLALVTPDTSPRGLNLKSQIEREYFGEGAGFYLDATELPWSKHYQMYSYVSKELPQLIGSHFPIDMARCGIFGHSMGGHGALTIGLRNPDLFRSLSAFAPICSPTQSPWGINALQGYLGDNKKAWQQYDACELLKTHAWPHGELLIDQGAADPFLKEELKPELLVAACRKANIPLNLRTHAHYGHNYYFIATFIEDHLQFHAKQLHV